MNREDYTHKLYSLGCAYSLDKDVVPPDLEQTILDGLKYYWFSNDIFFMLYGLLVHRIAHLVHIERLIMLSKKQKLGGDQLILLICISHKLIRSGHKNFSAVVRKLEQKNMKFKTVPNSESDSFLIERWGIDEDFKKYGVELRALPLEDKKKFFKLEKIFQMNKWLAIRAVAGANNRADIVYLKVSKIVPTANQAAQVLGCSKDAAYRYWRASVGLESVEIILE